MEEDSEGLFSGGNLVIFLGVLLLVIGVLVVQGVYRLVVAPAREIEGIEATATALAGSPDLGLPIYPNALIVQNYEGGDRTNPHQIYFVKDTSTEEILGFYEQFANENGYKLSVNKIEDKRYLVDFLNDIMGTDVRISIQIKVADGAYAVEAEQAKKDAYFQIIRYYNR